MTYNEEATLNNALAAVLRNGNPRWRGDRGSVESEQLKALDDGGKPDILLLDRGAAPVVVETEFLPAHTVEDDARKRLGRKAKKSNQTIEQAIALRVPQALREVAQQNLEEAVRQAEFEYCLLSIGPEKQDPTVHRFPTSGWLKGNVTSLANLLENASLSERLVSQSLDILQQAVFDAATELAFRSNQNVLKKIAATLHQSPGDQTERMAMAILANALIFHAAIAQDFDLEQPSVVMEKHGDVAHRQLSRIWAHILKEINYWPIFVIAQSIIDIIPDEIASSVIEVLAEAATRLAASGVARSHDITGRMFQRLISDRKFLATYYTRPESARFLAELAVDKLGTDWTDAQAIAGLRIGDLACGTGTLISAAYHAMITRYRRNNGDDTELHKPMIEQSLIAADIMPIATHLTTAMLSSVHPQVTFGGTQVLTLPYGKSKLPGVHPLHLGALDLIEDQGGVDLLGTGIERLHGGKSTSAMQLSEFSLQHDSLDLVIMNPPYARPTGHEAKKIGVPVPAFAGLGNKPEEQRGMSKRLAQLRRLLDEPAGHGNAGLATNFIDLAHVKLRAGGVLALVLPITMANGESWSASRNLLSKYYEDISFFTIVGTKAGQLSFSADTNMGEALVVARKRKGNRRKSEQPIRWVSLNRRPASLSEAMESARLVTPALAKNRRKGSLSLGDVPLGSYIVATIDDGGCASVFDPEVAESMLLLQTRELHLPRGHSPIPVPVTRLGDLGEPGIYHLDINGKDGRGPFDLVAIQGKPTYPILWEHHTARERSLIVAPDRQLAIRSGMQEKAEHVWGAATRLHLNRDLNLNVQSLGACMTEEPTLGGRAWPNFRLHNADYETVVALWANTTLGLMAFWWQGTRQHPGRAMVPVTAELELLTVNANELSKKQLAKAQRIFDEFAQREFLPVHRSWEDEVRIALDEAVLVGVLGLPTDVLEPLTLLRSKWCSEPSVHAGKTEHSE